MTEEKNPAPKKGGPKAVVHSQEKRDLVKALAAQNWDQPRIAKTIGVSVRTLTKRFRAELGSPPRAPKPKEFTDQQRGEVRGMAFANFPRVEIAEHLGIDKETLEKYFGVEISAGRTTLLAGAATNMARMALGAKAEFDREGHVLRAEVKPEFVACCYVLKSQGKDLGWNERTEHTGKNGEAIPVRFESLSDAQLIGFIDRIETALRARAG